MAHVNVFAALACHTVIYSEHDGRGVVTIDSGRTSHGTSSVTHGRGKPKRGLGKPKLSCETA